MQKTVLHNQSVFDVTLQHTGSFKGLFALALLNGLSITEDLDAGRVLEVPAVDNAELLNFYLIRNAIPATAINTFSITPEADGIGSMIIETNFIVQ
jgi:hypothetical protein